MLKDLRDMLICDFCGANQFEVAHMMADRDGRVHICDKCARDALDAIADSKKEGDHA